MTDADQAATPPQPAEGEGDARGLRVLAQFIRDLSFENPKAPESLRWAGSQPQMEVNVEMNARGRPDGLFEVDLKIASAANHQEGAVFQCELVYGGLFQLMGIPDEEVEPLLMVECPRLLFPFARSIIADLSVQSGFPPFMLDPLDFAGIYMAQKQQQSQLVTEPPVGHA
jgi:preprotein translocase subunit SecB